MNKNLGTDGRLHLEVDWFDWNDRLPATSDADELAQALEAEVALLISTGAYPASLRFERYIEGGLAGAMYPPVIEVSSPDFASLLEFYTAYCGGDAEQALEDLVEIEGFKPPTE